MYYDSCFGDLSDLSVLVDNYVMQCSGICGIMCQWTIFYLLYYKARVCQWRSLLIGSISQLSILIGCGFWHVLFGNVCIHSHLTHHLHHLCSCTIAPINFAPQLCCRAHEALTSLPSSWLGQSRLHCQLVAQASSSHPKWHPPLFIMNTTPPPTNPFPPKCPGTPVHTLSTTTGWFYEFEYRSWTFSHLTDEIEPFLIRPMPVEIFLELFLPSSSTPPFTNGMFNALVQMCSQCETSWYDVFMSSDPY